MGDIPRFVIPKQKSNLRYTMPAGIVFLGLVIALLVFAPAIWPAEIAKELMAKTAPPAPLRMGNPELPHVKIISVQKGTGPRVAPRKNFIPPVLTAPPKVPVGLPPLEPPGEPINPVAPPNVGDGNYCPGCIPGPPCPGCTGMDPRFMAPPPSPPTPPAKPKVVELPKEEPPQRIMVGGKVQQAKLISQPKPMYPPLAKQAGVSGVVRLQAVIGFDGSIHSLTLVSGHPLLVPAAMEAVKQWRYQPTELNDKPVEVVTQIDVNFTLNR
jgi:periplasmic protein TonB